MQRLILTPAHKVSPEVAAAVDEINQRAGIRDLRPGERRPDDYFATNHAFGFPIVRDKNAVVKTKP